MTGATHKHSRLYDQCICLNLAIDSRCAGVVHCRPVAFQRSSLACFEHLCCGYGHDTFRDSAATCPLTCAVRWPHRSSRGRGLLEPLPADPYASRRRVTTWALAAGRPRVCARAVQLAPLPQVVEKASSESVGRYPGDAFRLSRLTPGQLSLLEAWAWA